MTSQPRSEAPADPWADLDATGQAELVRRDEVAPAELVAAACARIERLDGVLGAVPVRVFDEALRAAASVAREAPFGGVPFLLKDLGARQAGHPYYAGNRALRDADHRAETDTPLGARFREIGLVTVGSSSTPEFGLQSNTWPLAYGPTHNPHAPDRAAGGSSGGACAAVAAGLVPVAHASDGAGSIRIPAAWCGLVGLKPSRDRVLWRHAGQGRPDVEFVVARSLRDTAAFLDLLRSPEARRAAPRPFNDALARELRGLRVGFRVASPAGQPVDPACADAVRRAAAALAAAGHAVEEEAPPSLAEYEERALHGAVFGFAEYRACLADLEERLGRPVGPDDVEPFLWELATAEAEPAGEEALARSVDWTAAWAERTRGWFEDHDLLLLPTVGEPAPALAELDPHSHGPVELLERMLLHMAFTEPWNATGQPALTLPLARDATGLPVGVQLVAGPYREGRLLSVAAALLADAPPLRPRVHA